MKTYQLLVNGHIIHAQYDEHNIQEIFIPLLQRWTHLQKEKQKRLLVLLAAPPGAGKTTLFRLMLDLLKADNGNVVINEIDVSQSEDWKNFTGAFIDDGFLIDYLTPEEYFYFIGKMYGLKKEEVDERLLPFERLMSGEVIGQKKLIRNYSAGNKQKIGIISAMLHYPQLLILDEPFNFLDPSSQSIIKHMLKKYSEEHNATVIISSHNLNHTIDVCPRIALLENGVIIRDIINENNSAEKELEDYFNVEE